MSLSFRRLRLFQRRAVWCPTLFGSFLILTLLVIPVAWWFARGESFLSLTERLPANILVVEGWIGYEGIRAAAAEFAQRGYQYVVATGGVTSAEGWQEAGWSYAQGAENELIRSGVPKERILVAPCRNTETQRTYESAVAVWLAIQAKGIQAKALNVFTMGPHARRSRLVFAKAYEPGTQVGVVSWAPPSYETEPWWRSSERAKELLTETAGYLYEVLLNSGRNLNSPQPLKTGQVEALSRHGIGNKLPPVMIDRKN
jgi:uncharacterized SAM-binding protein YcdF (DUF218 family)